MQFIPTSIPDIILIKPQIYSDNRGFFYEIYQEQEFKSAGISEHIVQDNHSGSVQGTLRGLHYQIKKPQGKLVRISKGEIFDVSVDLRKHSPYFGHWVGVRLSEQNKYQVWIPPGFAHGFYVLSEWAEVQYKASDYYAPHWERTLLWNDPEVGISWPLLNHMEPIISEKDAKGSLLKEAELFDKEFI
jgi:dTDP-4-dehydrorhamnose 3,5-epimerase